MDNEIMLMDDELEEDVPLCAVCGYEMETEECYKCFGEGGRDLYEENPVEYAPGDWENCDACEGIGYYWQCPQTPHMAVTA